MKGQYRLPLLLSLAFHAVLAVLLLANIEFEKKKIVPRPVPDVVQATVIDESKVLAELQKLKQQEIDKKQGEKAKQARLKKAQRKEEKRLADLKQKRVQEQKRAKEQATKNRAKEKAAALKLEKLKREKQAEKKKLDKLKKEKQLANQKRQKAEAEKRRKAEVARKKKAEKKKIEAEKRRKAEIAKKEKAEAEKAKALAEKKRQEKLAKEKAEKERKARELALKQQMEAERKAQQAVASFRDVIRQKIQRSWLKPSTSTVGLSCKIRVKLIAGGSVMDARVVKSSGDQLFDRSVEVAVLKASPLPIPNDPGLFSYFRTLDLIFIPKE